MLQNIQTYADVKRRRWRKTFGCILGIFMAGAVIGTLLQYGTPRTVVCVTTVWAFGATVVALVATIKPTQ